MIKTVQFANTYEVAGNETDAYFAALPATDLGCVLFYLLARKDVVAFNTILDIGANIGLAAMCIHDAFPQAKVHAFEPSNATFGHLTDNIGRNHLGQWVTTHKVAVGAARGTVNFLDRASNLAGSGVSNGAGSYAVPVISVDEFVVEHGCGQIDFIKIDVEGYEVAVLEGLRGVLSRDNPAVLLECIPAAIEMGGVTLEEFMAGVLGVFFQVGVVNGQNGGVAALPRDPARAASTLRSLMSGPYAVFDLINKIDDYRLR